MTTTRVAGTYIYRFVGDTSDLKDKKAEASSEADRLSMAIDRATISNDNLNRTMQTLAAIVLKASQTLAALSDDSEGLKESNEDLTTSIIEAKESIEELSESGINLNDTNKKTKESNDKVSNSLQKITRRVIGLAAAYFSAGKIIGGFRAAAGEGFGLANFSELLNLNINTVKNWQNVIEGLGGSKTEVTDSFRAISNAIQQLRFAGESEILAFETRLGVKIQDEEGFLDPDEILLNAAESIERFGFESQETAFISSQLGLGDTIARLIARGRPEVERLLREQRETQKQITDEEAKGLQSLQKQIADTQQTARSLFLEIGLDNLELAISFLKEIEKLINNIRFIAQAQEEGDAGIFGFLKEVLGTDVLDLLPTAPQSIIDRAEENRRMQEEAQLRRNAEIFIESQLQENARKFLENQRRIQATDQSSLNIPNNMPISPVNQYDFRGSTITTQAQNAEQLFSELNQFVNRERNESFTAASELLISSRIA